MLKPEDWADLEGALKKARTRMKLSSWGSFFCLLITVICTIVYWDKVGLSPCFFFVMGALHVIARSDADQAGLRVSELSLKIREIKRKVEEMIREKKTDN